MLAILGPRKVTGHFAIDLNDTRTSLWFQNKFWFVVAVCFSTSQQHEIYFFFSQKTRINSNTAYPYNSFVASVSRTVRATSVGCFHFPTSWRRLSWWFSWIRFQTYPTLGTPYIINIGRAGNFMKRFQPPQMHSSDSPFYVMRIYWWQHLCAL